jgi:crotonobetaine/carnitine-CoA ligase
MWPGEPGCDLTIPSFLAKTAEKEPQKTYLYYRENGYSYSEFVEKVKKAADGFQKLGIAKGDKVCLFLPNCPEFLYAWLGLSEIGAISVFINTALKRPEIRYIVNHSEAKAFVTISELWESMALDRREMPSLKYPVICIDSPSPDGAISFREIIEAASANPRRPQLSPEDVVTFIYTSGTTGLPKAVMQTHQTYVLTGEAIPSWLDISSHDRLFTCLPLFHINAQAYSVMGSLGCRGSLILGEKFSASAFWGQIAARQATEFNLIGAMPLLLLKQPPKDTDRTHGARLAYTAPALDSETHEEFESRFGVNLVVGYGMSESTFGTINPIQKENRRLGSIGRQRAHSDPRFGNQLRITGDDGNELEAAKTGEITLKNPAIMKGYYKDPEATNAVLRDGWLFTGDLAYKDREGFVYFAGRKKDMIRLKGENVSAYEVEAVIDAHPGVEESAVVGVPTEFGDERIVALVVAKPPGHPLAPSDIVDWCRARLADFKVPSTVQFREALPRTATEKIAKHILREELLSGVVPEAKIPSSQQNSNKPQVRIPKSF